VFHAILTALYVVSFHAMHVALLTRNHSILSCAFCRTLTFTTNIITDLPV